MKINRRTVLKGMLGGAIVTVGLPPLEYFMNNHGTAYAAGDDGFPQRFGLFFWGNGVTPERWIPVDDGKGWTLSEQLTPLAALQDDITLVTGMRVHVPNIEPHHATACGILTGRPLTMENGDHTFPGPTIDQTIASHIGNDTLFRSIEFGSEPGHGMSHNGPWSLNPPEKSPIALFERLFGPSFQLPGEEAIVDPSLGLRRSVLDAVMVDLKKVKTSVGAADQIRLEQHLEGIRALEKRLAKLEEDPPNAEACAVPLTPEAEYPDLEGRPQLKEKNRAMCDVIALALACDQTRVFSNVLTKPLTNILFTDSPAGHHNLTHDEPEPQPEVNKIVVQCMEELAYQMEALRKIEEGDGNLLDNSLVFATSDVSNGKMHSPYEFPIILGGSAGGKLKTGLHVRTVANENTSKVLHSICTAFGMNISEFGEAEGLVTEGLSDIEV
jgi:hypothetical protein